MDGCYLTIAFFSFLYLAYAGVRFLCWCGEENAKRRQTQEAERAAAEAARAEREFQEKHPELWRQRELLKLDKERLAALEAQREKDEAGQRGVGAIMVIGRILNIW